MKDSRIEDVLKEKVNKGYNCAQAVAMAYCDLLGIDPEATLKGMEPFGSGMGSKLGTCGAVSGAIYISGFKASSDVSEEAGKSKKEAYDMAGKITQEFIESHGSLVCKDLKDVNGPHFTKCPDCIAHAASLVEKIVFPGEFKDNTCFEKK